MQFAKLSMVISWYSGLRHREDGTWILGVHTPRTFVRCGDRPFLPERNLTSSEQLAVLFYLNYVCFSSHLILPSCLPCSSFAKALCCISGRPQTRYLLWILYIALCTLYIVLRGFFYILHELGAFTFHFVIHKNYCKKEVKFTVSPICTNKVPYTQNTVTERVHYQ